MKSYVFQIDPKPLCSVLLIMTVGRGVYKLSRETSTRYIKRESAVSIISLLVGEGAKHITRFIPRLGFLEYMTYAQALMPGCVLLL